MSKRRGDCFFKGLKMLENGMVLQTKHLDPSFRREFIQELEARLVQSATDGKSPQYIETIIDMCEIHEIEPEAVSSMISGPIRDKIEAEAISKRMIKKDHSNELPI